MSRRVHVLKCDDPYFSFVINGYKLFEVRKNDRDFKTGDWLLLKSPPRPYAESDTCMVKIKYILKDGEAERYGIKKGYCVLGIDPERILFEFLVTNKSETRTGTLSDINVYRYMVNHITENFSRPLKLKIRWPGSAVNPVFEDIKDLNLIGSYNYVNSNDVIVNPL